MNIQSIDIFALVHLVNILKSLGIQYRSKSMYKGIAIRI